MIAEGTDTTIAFWLMVVCGGSVLAFMVYSAFWALFHPEQARKNRREAALQREKAKAEAAENRRERAKVMAATTPKTAGYSGYAGSVSRKDLAKPVVVRTLPRMTAPYVRQRMIEDFAANGYAMMNMTRTTTGKTIMTFVRQGTAS